MQPTAVDDAAPIGSTAASEDEEIRLQGERSMWVFVLGDMIIFGVYFLIYMIARTRQRHLFLVSQQHLSQTTGAINTLMLLASSWFVARAVRAARTGDYEAAKKLMVSGGACGVAFMVIKVFEWHAEISQGHTLTSNNFFMFYFMLTGVHLLHVAMGLIIVGVVLRELRDPELRRIEIVESGAIYWHMVDLLWIVVFALIYVMR
jgi:nitric oxide reductase NorE protein